VHLHDVLQDDPLPGRVIEPFEGDERPGEARGQRPGPLPPQAVERGLAGEEPARGQAVDHGVEFLRGDGVPQEQVGERGVINRMWPVRRAGAGAFKEFESAAVVALRPGYPCLLV